MIEPGMLFTDAELANAYRAGYGAELLSDETDTHSLRHLRACFSVAQLAIAAFIRAVEKVSIKEQKE